MPAFASISLKNQAATEVVYAPAEIETSTGVAKWLGAGAVFDAKPVVTFSTTYPKGNSTKVKAKGKISFSIMDPVTPTIKIDELIATFEFSLPKNSALLDRQNIRASLADMLTDAVVVKAIEDFESVY